MRLALGLLLAMTACVTAVFAEPVVDLRIGTSRFPSGSTIRIPASSAEPLNIWLEDAIGVVEIGSVRVTLNGTPMSAFATVNRLPRGVRVILRMGVSLGPDFTLRRGAENVLMFQAVDETKVSYSATFYMVADDTIDKPVLAPLQRERPMTVTPPPVVRKPTVKMLQELPEESNSELIEIAAAFADEDGLRRIVIQLNGRDEDEVILQNEQPVRKRRGWMARGGEPGTVSGDGHKVEIRGIPIRLRRNSVNVVLIKAENVSGVVESIERSIKVPR